MRRVLKGLLEARGINKLALTRHQFGIRQNGGVRPMIVELPENPLWENIPEPLKREVPAH